MHQVNQAIRVKIHDLSRAGSGVAKLETGEVVFVPFTAPGDEVWIEIVKKEKKFSHGKLLEVITPSEFRVTPPCKVFTVCGGCAWQHLHYDLQFETKKKGLIHAMKRLGMEFSLDEVQSFPSKNHYGYRNRIQLRGNLKKEEFGFFQKASQTIVNIDRCEITDESINAALPSIKKETVAHGNPFTSEYKVETEVTPSGKVRSAWNEKHAAFGFRQIHDEQNKKLQAWVSENVGSGGVLLDLFGGDGNLSRPLASRFSTIHCVDLSVPTERPSDVPEHFEFHRSDVVRWLQYHPSQPKTEATLIVDPPREGLGRNFPAFWSELSSLYLPKRVLLIGCDVDSFTTDCLQWTKQGYKIQKLAALDFFPQTPHLESLALLTL